VRGELGQLAQVLAIAASVNSSCAPWTGQPQTVELQMRFRGEQHLDALASWARLSNASALAARGT